mmetsp:Transcript_32856/g.50236  ORF Transcript_32856/g.50236 Transcript_32856/m.50236 type:complete len:139 (-) Transcript_32856:25-441(-)
MKGGDRMFNQVRIKNIQMKANLFSHNNQISHRDLEEEKKEPIPRKFIKKQPEKLIPKSKLKQNSLRRLRMYPSFIRDMEEPSHSIDRLDNLELSKVNSGGGAFNQQESLPGSTVQVMYNLLDRMNSCQNSEGLLRLKK